LIYLFIQFSSKDTWARLSKAASVCQLLRRIWTSKV